jgi:hypothetical protein
VSRSRCVAVAVTLASAGCGGAISLRIDSDRPVPAGIDSICVGVADTSLSGGHFGRNYRLEDALAGLPQTLRLEPGDADSAFAWVRADRGGVPVLRASAVVDFGDDVTLALPRCEVGTAGNIVTFGVPAGPADAQIAASQGQGGMLVVAVGPMGAMIVNARGSSLFVKDAPIAPPGTPLAVVPADVDGDCDDDVVIVTSGSPPTIWIRDGITFTAGDSIGSAPVAAVAAADVDRDGDTDLVLGGGNNLQLWRNDASGSFTHIPQVLSAGTRATAISALALGDLDGDGNPDLVVGQDGPPLVAWLGGVGTFEPSDGVAPPLPLSVARFALGDADGDYDPDLAIAIRTAPMRLLVDRDGRLEDQSFLRLPQPAATIRAAAFGGWDAGCEPDAILASQPGAAALRGLPGGTFEAELATPPATDATLTDIDDDGDLDAILSTPEGLLWLGR